MDRRAFVVVLASGMLTAPRAVRAQPAAVTVDLKWIQRADRVVE